MTSHEGKTIKQITFDEETNQWIKFKFTDGTICEIAIDWDLEHDFQYLVVDGIL
jgi:hypothetical protein